MSEIRPRKIVGIQVHHSVNLDDACRFGANMATAIEAALQRRDDPGLEFELANLQIILTELSRARAEAKQRLADLAESDSKTFRQARDGDIPWPDEREEGFVARCRCDDKCLYHDQGVGAPDDCNCNIKCRQHS